MGLNQEPFTTSPIASPTLCVHSMIPSLNQEGLTQEDLNKVFRYHVSGCVRIERTERIKSKESKESKWIKGSKESKESKDSKES